jgi:hypothetical protein
MAGRQRKQIARKSYGENHVTFRFYGEPDADGEAPVVVERDYVVDGLPADIVRRLELRGLAEKLSDSLLQASDAQANAARTDDSFASLVAGEWGRDRETDRELLIEASLNVQRAKLGEIPEPKRQTWSEYVKGLDARSKELNKLRRVPEVQLEMARLRAERGVGAEAGDLFEMMEAVG